MQVQHDFSGREEEAGEILTSLKRAHTSQGLCVVTLQCVPYNQIHNETIDVYITVLVMVHDVSCFHDKSEYSQDFITLQYH